MNEIQSLSITVPTGGCVNDCKYCVSKMHKDSWIKDRFKGKNIDFLIKNSHFTLEDNKIVVKGYGLWHPDISRDEHFENLNLVKENYKEIKYELQDFYERLKFARDNGVNTVILTGVDGEILQNKPFLKLFKILNNLLPSPFSWIEVQTSGVMLEDKNLDFLKDIGVKTISLSVSNIFDDKSNAEITQIPEKLKFNIDELCVRIKDKNFNLRLSLNLSDVYDGIPAWRFFKTANELNADQITFRVLYTSTGGKSEEDKWIEEHRIHEDMMKAIKDYIIENGELIGVLTFGAKQYGVRGISTVIDQDCMNKEIKETLKYIILREDLKLYSKWSTKSSLLF